MWRRGTNGGASRMGRKGSWEVGKLRIRLKSEKSAQWRVGRIVENKGCSVARIHCCHGGLQPACIRGGDAQHGNANPSHAEPQQQPPWRANSCCASGARE